MSRSLPLALATLLLVACGDGTTVTDAGRDLGTGTDLGAGTDLGSTADLGSTDLGPATDLGSGDSGAADLGVATDSGVTAADVTACQASVDAVRAACVTEDPTNDRICFYDAVRPLCATGRTLFVKAIFDCLMMDACQSPSDPSGATSCVQAAIHSAATATDHAAGHADCLCPAAATEPNCSISEPAYVLAILMLMREPDVAAFTSCLESSGCDAEGTCVGASPLAPALACP